MEEWDNGSRLIGCVDRADAPLVGRSPTGYLEAVVDRRA